MSMSFPPHEDSPQYKHSSSSTFMLAFMKPVFPSSGNISFIPRSVGSKPIVMQSHNTTIVRNLHGHTYVYLQPPLASGQGLEAGEIYDIKIDLNSFLDYFGSNISEIKEPYTISTMPHLMFRRMSESWSKDGVVGPSPRLAAAATMDAANRIVVIGGRNGTNTSNFTMPKDSVSPQEVTAFNDLWRLRTYREVSCASALSGETGCTLTKCQALPGGGHNLGTETRPRSIWRRKSITGNSCINDDGFPRSLSGQQIGEKVSICPCPTCTNPPGPVGPGPLRGTDLPLFMANNTYVLDYELVPSSTYRPLLCAPGRTPSGNFYCKLFDRYFGKFEMPYPTCENSTCKEPPLVGKLDHFQTLDIARTTGKMNCSHLSPEMPMPHNGTCAILCEPGWKATAGYRCDQGEFVVPKCIKQRCNDYDHVQNGRLDCNAKGEFWALSSGLTDFGPYYEAVCEVLCQPGYLRTSWNGTCDVAPNEKHVPEAVPFFQPPPVCVPGDCRNYIYLDGAEVTYLSPNASTELKREAMVTCLDGYEMAGTATGMTGAVKIRCGPMYDLENLPEVEWKLAETGARAGLVCAPKGMMVVSQVGLAGYIKATLELPEDVTLEALCTTLSYRFVTDLGLSLAMGITAATEVLLEAEAVGNVVNGACEDWKRDNEDGRLLQAKDRGSGNFSNKSTGRRLQWGERVRTEIDFSVEVADDLEAEYVQAVMRTEDGLTAFQRTFALALESASGAKATDISIGTLVKLVLYSVAWPDNVVKTGKDSETKNKNASTTTRPNLSTKSEDDDTAAFIGIAVGLCLCCNCVGCGAALAWRRNRRKYASMVDPTGDDEEGEEEEEVAEDPAIEDPDAPLQPEV
eukprot:TRINITY_DN4070_c0_g2_i1.p1 TRINITY_DN4070_c0_g2~~TRINITY_DN4070_c0_g2_i1.p1  ORF type:complete len:903 (-),score=129.30 TRINITY_DN4070_c0_g2_i1:497-3061(-)